MHPLDTYFRNSLTAELSESEHHIWCSDSDNSASWWRLFRAQATSRHLDFVARELQQQGRGFYTIGSLAMRATP
jgi:2-oxoisovalerate dehydrogenase E1 component